MFSDVETALAALQLGNITLEDGCPVCGKRHTLMGLAEYDRFDAIDDYLHCMELVVAWVMESIRRGNPVLLACANALASIGYCLRSRDDDKALEYYETLVSYAESTAQWMLTSHIRGVTLDGISSVPLLDCAYSYEAQCLLLVSFEALEPFIEAQYVKVFTADILACTGAPDALCALKSLRAEAECLELLAVGLDSEEWGSLPVGALLYDSDYTER